MRLRNAPQPKLRLRNRLKTTLFVCSAGLLTCLAVWVATRYVGADASSDQAYPYPVTVSQQRLRGGIREAAVATEEINRINLQLETVEGGKGVDPQARLQAIHMRKQLKILEEIEDHEMRISLRALDANFDPEPYQSKVNMLRARLREISGSAPQ